MADAIFTSSLIVCKDGIPLGGGVAPPSVGLQFKCDNPNHVWQLYLVASGGVPPYTWITDKGKLTTWGVVNENALIELNAATGAGTIHCGCEDEDRENSLAYAVAGKAIFNSLTPNCDRYDGDPYGGFTWNCKGEVVACGIIPGVQNGDGLVITAGDIPIVCEQINEAEDCGAQPCGQPWCGSTPYCLCNCSGNGNNTCFGSPREYIFANGGGQLFDLRTNAMKTEGCWPCKVLEGGDINVLLMDSNGALLPIVIPVVA